MTTRRWVTIGLGVGAAAVLVWLALLIDEHWMEVASWVASVASLAVAVVAAVRGSRPAAPPTTAPAAQPGSVHAGGDITGIVSTGDRATNVQQR